MTILEQAEANVQGAIEMKGAIVEYGQEEYTRGWDEAMVQSGTVNSGDKIYSEVEMNQILSDESTRLQGLFDAQAESLQSQIDGIPAQIESAKSEIKSELKAAYEAQQVAESEGETGFAELLK